MFSVSLIAPAKVRMANSDSSRRLGPVTIGLTVFLRLPLVACGSGSVNRGGPNGPVQASVTGSGANPAAAVTLSPTAQLGEKIFSDASLSAPGRLSCAFCHAPANAHAQSNNLAAQLGGSSLQTSGMRAAQRRDGASAVAIGDRRRDRISRHPYRCRSGRSLILRPIP